MGLVGHLEELRKRIFVCLAALGIAAVLLFFQGRILLAFLESSAQGAVTDFIFITPTEAFGTYVKVVLLSAFIVSFPVLLYEFWAFIAPAFSRASRPIIFLWLVLAVVCFYGGIIFSYVVLLPAALHFLLGFAQGIARPMISIGQYISFAATLILIGGCVFEIPVVLGLLTEAGVLKPAHLRSGRRAAVLIILIIAAIVTPTQDAVNLALFAVPMVALYEVGILLSALVEKRRNNLKT